MKKYALGLDFGTLSLRALIADIETGQEAASVTVDYPHGVMDTRLPDGTRLPPDWALQHPGDYLECLRQAIPEAIERAGIDSGDIVGVGVDGTSCTMIAMDKEGTPLCLLPGFAGEKHAWPKLWKHHAAQSQADRMTEAALSRGEGFIEAYGGKISSEWLFPKIWQVVEEAPAVYAATDRFSDLADWIVLLLTGEKVYSSCLMGYKAFWNRQSGYPSEDFFASLDPRLKHVARDKLAGEVLPVCGRAGFITDRAAALTGLKAGTPVAVATTDAHVALPAVNVIAPGSMLMIMGTSTVHLAVGDDAHPIPGICGVHGEGVYPNVPVYEAGQCCVGDHFDWFVRTLTPKAYALEAEARGMDAHQILTEKAAALKSGESGLLALDWWNGNRSVLNDGALSGLMLGMTLTTRPEEIYRALIEATAFGTRMIIENYESHGVPVGELYACGGISFKNRFMMQLYADVLGKPIRLARSRQTPALGSAIMGALAAGSQMGGYDDYKEAAARMGGVGSDVFTPDAGAGAVYDRLYDEYRCLHDFFGRGGSGVMKELRDIRRRAAADDC